MIANTDENRIQTFETLKSLGLQALVTSTDSLYQVEATWLQLGDATGTTGLARDYRERIAAARTSTRGGAEGCPTTLHTRPSLARPLDCQRFRDVSGITSGGCGFRNAFSQSERKWPKIALNGNKGSRFQAGIGSWLESKWEPSPTM